MTQGLRKRVAQLFCGGSNPCEACFKDADAAIALVLEEAAKVVDEVAKLWFAQDGTRAAVEEAAAAIRAMKEGK